MFLTQQSWGSWYLHWAGPRHGIGNDFFMRLTPACGVSARCRLPPFLVPESGTGTTASSSDANKGSLSKRLGWKFAFRVPSAEPRRGPTSAGFCLALAEIRVFFLVLP
jgi:hypothetical protein